MGAELVLAKDMITCSDLSKQSVLKKTETICIHLMIRPWYWVQPLAALKWPARCRHLILLCYPLVAGGLSLAWRQPLNWIDHKQ